MTSTKYDKSFDEMLEGKEFQGQNALEYLKGDFSDDELHQLDKQELINLFTKAFVLICLQESKHVNLLKQNVRLEGLLQKHLEIYPELKDADKSELDFEIVKSKAELKNIFAQNLPNYAQGLGELAKKLPEIRKKGHKEAASKGGKARAENDNQHKKMEIVKAIYLEKWNAGYRFPHGTLTKFYKGMETDHKLEFTSIKNAIENYRKELGHETPKKQSS